MTRALRAAFVYPNPRLELAEAVREGRAPDTALLGQNHLAALGVESRIHESRLRRRTRERGLVHRATWTLRELALPWELRDDDVLVTPLADLAPLAARLRRRPRVVLLDWGIAGRLARLDGLKRRVLLAAVRSASLVLSPSASMRERLLAVTGLDPARVPVVPLGADANWLAPTREPREPFVLAVGKDMARDYDTLAAALRLTGGPAVLVAEPRNLVGVDLPDGVEVRRGVPWEELRSLYARAACVVLPLRGEAAGVGSDGSGLTALLEAMAVGAPVVAAARPVIADYVEDGRSGLLVPPEDPEALAAAIERVRSEPARAASLGSAARAAVEERYTTRALAERLVAVMSPLAQTVR